MFRRKWSGLPADPAFPLDLQGLGYFINEDDEVRSIANPEYYFKYFISRNERYNERQRFAMNFALEQEIHRRLTRDLGLAKVLLPLGTTDPKTPHVPIMASIDKMASASRVVLIFGETFQDLGVVAHRIIGGPGGVDKGSMVSFVRAVLDEGQGRVGVILANMGQLLWWAEGDPPRPLTRSALAGAPMRSAVHDFPRGAAIPNHGSTSEHVRAIFEEVVPALVPTAAALDIVAVGDAADVVEAYLDHEDVWRRWRSRLGCFANVGGYFPVWELKCDGFKQFLRNRARAYTPSTEPLGTVLSGPDGNSHTSSFTQLGCPVLSGGTEYYTETLLIEGRRLILDFLQEVALHDKDNNGSRDGDGYKNPEFFVTYVDMRAVDTEVDDWTGWVDDENSVEATAGCSHQENPQKGGPSSGTSVPKIVTTDADLESQNDCPDAVRLAASTGDPAPCAEHGDGAVNAPDGHGVAQSIPGPGFQLDLPLRLRENDIDGETKRA